MRYPRHPRPPRVDPQAVQDLWCPYCGQKAMLRNAAEVYGAKYAHVGNLYVCPQWPTCDSYVGCHRGTMVPLGRMADKELRLAKSAAHRMFDALWKKRVLQGLDKKTARGAGYAWLSKATGINREKCHIGMMDVKECREVIAVCAPYFNRPEAPR